MADLKFSKINKIYPNGVQAVFDFDLDIKDKEFIVFVGPSGCGKSTTLRMVAGLEDISSGELYIDGRLVNSVEPKDRDVAMVFQSYALYPHMTVYENMSFALKLRKTFKPIYEPNEEIQPLLVQKKEIKKQIQRVNRKYKKKQQDDNLLKERQELYCQLFKLIEEIENKLTQKTGIDELKIKLKTKELNKSQKILTKLEKENGALLAKIDNLQNKENLSEKEQEALKEAQLDLQSNREETKLVNLQMDKLKGNIEYLKNNEVPLEALRKPTREEVDIEIEKAAENIDLVKYLYRKPSALSGGQRQRVALGRAIVRKPKVFLMDEPLSNLDAKLRVQTRTEITKIHQRVGATTIYVTHDQTEAMTMASRIVIMKDGYVQQIGTPEEVYGNPQNMFVGGFIGSPSMNFLTVTYSKGTVTTSSGFSFNIKKEQAEALKEYEGKEIVMGVRPEHIHLTGDLNNNAPTKPLSSICDSSELLGYERIVYFYIGENKVLLKTSSKNEVVSGQKFDLCFDLDCLYFFNKDNENRIA